MASSYNDFKEEIKEYIQNKFNTDISILDVGAGSGTYQELLSDYKNIDAVEVFEPNIEKYKLREKYRNVINADIRGLMYQDYDLIIFGDVLEHLEVSEAKETLAYAYNHSKEVIVAVPYLYKQGIEYDNVYEIHKQDDLTNELFLERYPFMKLLMKNDRYGYYIKGE